MDFRDSLLVNHFSWPSLFNRPAAVCSRYRKLLRGPVHQSVASPRLLSFLMTSQVSEEQLLTALTTRAIETVGERFIKSLDATAASESRDALAKNLYAKLFDWLVAAINRKISALGEPQCTTRLSEIWGILRCLQHSSFQESASLPWAQAAHASASLVLLVAIWLPTTGSQMLDDQVNTFLQLASQALTLLPDN